MTPGWKNPEKGQKACPVCGKPMAEKFRPFCSARCAEIDLGRWLKGAYRIPTDETPEEGESPAPEDDQGGA